MPERLVQCLPSPYKKTDCAGCVLLFDHVVLQEFALRMTSRYTQYLSLKNRRITATLGFKIRRACTAWMTYVTMGESLAVLSNHCRFCSRHTTR